MDVLFCTWAVDGRSALQDFRDNGHGQGLGSYNLCLWPTPAGQAPVKASPAHLCHLCLGPGNAAGLYEPCFPGHSVVLTHG